jgi:tRNA threonylcarbamoyl adenosine modification protein YjeE
MVKKKSLEWRNCSESELETRISEWWDTAKTEPTKPSGGVIIDLVGDMGAGKSTWARAFLKSVAPGQVSRGSPTFPLVHGYVGPDQNAIYHIDLYRLDDEQELEDSGILHQIEEPGAWILIEWTSKFPEYFKSNFSKVLWRVEIRPGDTPELRHISLLKSAR